MSNQKIKSENYQNFGGINQKISQYDTQNNEFLDLKNFDFQTPGALTERWGSTQYMSQGFSQPISFLTEFQKLNGNSFLFIGTTGALWYGATTGQHQGVSLNTISSTQVFVAGQYNYWGFDNTLGPVFGLQPSSPLNVFNNFYWGNAFYTVTINAYQHADNSLNAVPLVDNLFLADSNKFLRFDGTTFYPELPLHPMPVRQALGTSIYVSTGAITTGFGYATMGWWSMYASYKNTRGFEGPIWPIFTLDCSVRNAGGSVIVPIAASFGGGTFVTGFIDLYTPSAYGITSINIYTYFKSQIGATLTPLVNPVVRESGGSLWNPNYVFYANFPVTGETTRITIGTTHCVAGAQGFSSIINNIGQVPDPIVNERFVLGSTFINTDNYSTIKVNYNTTAPKLLESHKNRIFAVTPDRPSVAFYSESGEPEGFQVNNSFEVRTNDGDVLTAMKSYSNKLCLFKKNSFHVLYGDDETNFILQEASNVYGCLNYRCVVVFEDILGFLDRKGIVIYNGAKPEIISQKIQPIFDRMNFSVALNTAVMVHDKLRNQIMCAIPVDGSTQNNLTVVFDYLAKAWTTYDGFNPTVFAQIQGRNNTKNVFYGTSTGIVNWFGSSFFSDNGVGATTYMKTRFIKDMGDSVQKQYRRLFLNVEADASATYVIPVNFFQDYGSSKVLQTTMTLGQFQDRIDFGISAKSLAFELSNIQTNAPLKIYGFTIESRLQRKV